MQPTPTFGYEQIVTELIRGILDTVADRPGLSPERKASAQQTVVCTVMSYNPRDAIETMLAGQCVVYDALSRDGARDMLRGQSELMKIKARSSILSSGKMFLGAMEMGIRVQGRGADQLAFCRPVEAPAVAVKKPVAPEVPVTPEVKVANEAPPVVPPAEPREPSSVVRPSPVEPVSPGVTAAFKGAPIPTHPDAPAQKQRPDAIEMWHGHAVAEEIVQHIPRNDLGPEEKQDIRASVMRTSQGTGQSLPSSATGNTGHRHTDRT